jgi:hypothetical protein
MNLSIYIYINEGKEKERKKERKKEREKMKKKNSLFCNS